MRGVHEGREHTAEAWAEIPLAILRTCPGLFSSSESPSKRRTLLSVLTISNSTKPAVSRIFLSYNLEKPNTSHKRCFYNVEHTKMKEYGFPRASERQDKENERERAEDRKEEVNYVQTLDKHLWQAAARNTLPLIFQPLHKVCAIFPVVLKLIFLSKKLLTKLSQLF